MWFDPTTVTLANPTSGLHDLPSFIGARGKKKKTISLLDKVKVGKVTKQSGLIDTAIGMGMSALKGMGGASTSAEKTVGPVSSILSKVGTIAQTAALVPVLTEFAEPVAWAAATAAGVATTLGYGNPRTETPPVATMGRTRDMCTVDQAVPGFVYAFSGSARVGKVPPGGITVEDELHFGHLLPMSVYLDQIVWQTSQGADYGLLEDLSISTGLGVLNDAGLMLAYAPWRAVLGMFCYWRGHIRITIKIAKTRFHSGRLLCFFDCDPTIVHNVSDGSEMLPRLIIDLESGNEWTFEFPFPAQNMYNRVYDGLVLGSFSIRVLTPLTACGAAASSVDIILETSVRPDASFMYPAGVSWQVGGTLPNSVSEPIALTNMTLSTFKDPVDIELACVGDSCRTLRTYLKRPVWYSSADTPDFQILMNQSLQTVNPVLNRVGNWYALIRGSTRTSVNVTGGVAQMYLDLPQSYIDTTSSPTNYFQLIQQNVVIDCEVPQMATMPWRYNTTAVPDDTQGIFQYPVLHLKAATTNDLLVATSTADDFDLAFFIGIQPEAATASQFRKPKQVRPPRKVAEEED